MALTDLEVIMTLSISPFSESMARQLALFEQHRSVMEEAERFKRQVTQMEEFERIRKLATNVQGIEHIRKIAELSEVSNIARSIRAARQQALEHIERFRQTMEIVDRIRRQMMAAVSHDRPTARDKAGASGSGRKSSAKKSAKSSGGDGGGGGGDGDGDGPQRPPSRPRRPQKKHSTAVTKPQTVASRTISPPQFPPTQSQPPSPQTSLSLAHLVILGSLFIVFIAENQIFAIIVFAILALCLTGHSKVVTTLLTSKAIVSWLERICGKDGQ
jgi:hypothetical protein